MTPRIVRIRRIQGFTLIEVVVVLVVLSLLVSIALPAYVERADQARETVLRENLTAMRSAIDKFHADQGRYPSGLNELVARRYLRELPMDPVTDSRETWVEVPAAEVEARLAAQAAAAASSLPLGTLAGTPAGAPPSGMGDVRSGSDGRTRAGVEHAQL